MRNSQRLAIVAALAAAAADCGSLRGERPAVLPTPTLAERAALARAVSQAFDGAPVTLADDAFARDSALTIERRTPVGPNGQAATGRTLDEPFRVRLVVENSRCKIVRASDGREFQVNGVRCVPLDARR